MARRSTIRGTGTLASIAAELGVSRTTVSNAYNRPEQLSPQLREKILATAEKLGYPGPDPTARSLRTRRAGSVGVLLTEHLSYAFEDMASVDFLAGVADATHGSHTTVTLIPASPETSVDLASAQQLVNSTAVDGFVIYSVAKEDPHLKAVRNRGLPVVICDQPADEFELPFVGIDDRSAIAPAARALIDAGHRRIGMLTIRLDRVRNDGRVTPARLESAGHHVQRSRVLGALDVFAEAGISRDDVPIVECWLNDREHNAAAAQILLESNPDITAVLCTTDSLALATLEYAQARGISVPGQLSITGFDGTAMALKSNLATVIQPNRQKGAETGRTLFQMIERRLAGGDAAPVQRVVLETIYHPGQTVGPVPGPVQRTGS